ncbi:MAG: hypothetical protein WBQ21_00865 [Solirubrobacteraceae bacterium]
MLVELSDLTRGASVGKGGQGTIYEAQASFLKRIGWHSAAVLKVYDSYLGADALDAFDRRSEWAMELPPSVREDLFRAACWPLAAVSDRGKLAGIVMPDERPRHGVSIALPSGKHKEVLLCLEHLLKEDSYTERRFELSSNTRVRAKIAELMAGSLAVLHRHSIVVSDFSHRNVLVRLSDPYAVTLIDCDSMRFQGQLSLKPVETPDWDMPEAWNEPAASRSADAYKLGLAILRLFARKQNVRHLGEAERHVPTPLRALLSDALARDPQQRPAAGRWQSALRDVLGTQLERDFPGPANVGAPKSAAGGAQSHAEAQASPLAGTPAAAFVTPQVTLHLPPIGTGPSPAPSPAMSPFTATSPSPAATATPSTPFSPPPPVSRNAALTTAGGTRPRRGPRIAAAVILCSAVALYAALHSSSPPASQASQLASQVASYHLIALGGAGEAGWIVSKGGHIWMWDAAQARLVLTRSTADPPLFASVYWQGRYAHRHAQTRSPTRVRHSSPRRVVTRAPSAAPKARRSSSVASGTPSGSQAQSSSPPVEATHSAQAPSTRPVKAPAPHPSGGAGGLGGSAEPSSSGGSGLEGKAESESQRGGGGGLSGSGE